MNSTRGRRSGASRSCASKRATTSGNRMSMRFEKGSKLPGWHSLGMEKFHGTVARASDLGAEIWCEAKS